MTCPGCGLSQADYALTGADPLSGDRFDVLRCRGCSLAFVDPIPSGDKLVSYYPDGYYGERHPVFKDQVMGWRADKLGRGRQKGRLLDIGCGRGDFILACRRRGWDVAGIEQSQSPVMELRQSLGIDVVTPERISTLEDASFDVVTLWHVLEHLPEPRDTIREAYRLLRPGGRLLVEVPNFGSWQARVGRGVWYHLDVPRHLLHFDEQSLTSLLKDAGFSIGRVSTFSLEYDTFGFIQTVLNFACRQHNHLFQMLIGKPVRRDLKDTLLSFSLALPLGVILGPVSLIAPLFRKGGVLRTVASKAVSG